MADLNFENGSTALIVVDPYNDFLSEGGKVWDRVKDVAEANQCIPNMARVLGAARAAELRVFYALHRRYRPGDYESWKFLAPTQRSALRNQTFAYGTWGGELRTELAPVAGEISALEHWCSSGFANTDLDMHLKRHGIQRLIVIGLLAATCIEATVRFAAELGYDVTVVRDAVADYTQERMHSALEVNIPNYASAIVTSNEAIEAIALSAR
jgi:nicotinamidase-related amidase